METSKLLIVILLSACMLTACGLLPSKQTEAPIITPYPAPTPLPQTDVVSVVLSDNGITADGQAVGTDPTRGIYVANDIIYYESGKDFTYGEGSEADAHTADEAAAHTVVHISQPGSYSLSGKLSLGQIAIDLGEEAKEDPQAVVTLILNGADITCEVAPAVIFYRVYECCNDDASKASKDVDTFPSGANVIIADGTTNTVNGSYVARIYKPGSAVLNEDKTEVEDAKKLHKYDGAFYSKMSMNIYGDSENTGVLNINAENEGLDSELHLTVNGGNINIHSGNDGINTNEDGVSVTTVNGGKLTITITGETGEGDGIDSNGWLVINGGTVITSACAKSADAGIDSDMGIHINGGTVIASGNMLDRIEDGGQNYAVFNFAQNQSGGVTITLKDKDGNAVFEAAPENAYSILICSSPKLTAGTYTLWSNGRQLAGQSGGMGGGMGGGPGFGQGGMNPPQRPEGSWPPQGQQPPDGFTPPELPNGSMTPQGQEPPEGFTPPDGNRPMDNLTPPDGGNFQMPGGNRPGFPGSNAGNAQELSPDFVIQNGGNMFSGITYLQ